MRIISGEFGGRRLKAVPGQNTRPTTDKIKESLFNILGGYFDGGVMLDMYSGAEPLPSKLSLVGWTVRFYSRTIALHKRRLSKISRLQKSPEQFHLKRQNVKQGLKTIASDPAFEPFELVFMDPPYRLQEIVKDIEQLQELNLVSPDCVIVCEVDKEVQLPERF